jgi:hypothetical protein
MFQKQEHSERFHLVQVMVMKLDQRQTKSNPYLIKMKSRIRDDQSY